MSLTQPFTVKSTTAPRHDSRSLASSTNSGAAHVTTTSHHHRHSSRPILRLSIDGHNAFLLFPDGRTDTREVVQGNSFLTRRIDSRPKKESRVMISRVARPAAEKVRTLLFAPLSNTTSARKKLGMASKTTSFRACVCPPRHRRFHRSERIPSHRTPCADRCRGPSLDPWTAKSRKAGSRLIFVRLFHLSPQDTSPSMNM